MLIQTSVLSINLFVKYYFSFKVHKDNDDKKPEENIFPHRGKFNAYALLY